MTRNGAKNLTFFCEVDGLFSVRGQDRKDAERLVLANHYAHSLPSGKTHVYAGRGAVVMFSIPANRFAARVLLGRDGDVWELTRLWAPDGHEKNLLTWAISRAVRAFHRDEPSVEALVSYADPNVGHEGFVYRAASWVYCGRSEESRYYRKNGQVVARRKFHSGGQHLNNSEIVALGYEELKLPGKHRFGYGLTKRARREIQAKAALETARCVK